MPQVMSGGCGPRGGSLVNPHPRISIPLFFPFGARRFEADSIVWILHLPLVTVQQWSGGPPIGILSWSPIVHVPSGQSSVVIRTETATHNVDDSHVNPVATAANF